jgi:hypothetical protein
VATRKNKNNNATCNKELCARTKTTQRSNTKKQRNKEKKEMEKKKKKIGKKEQKNHPQLTKSMETPPTSNRKWFVFCGHRASKIIDQKK